MDIEKKMRELVDWDEVDYHIELIQIYLKEISCKNFDYIQSIKKHIECLEEIFSIAKEQATLELFNNEEVKS